MTKKLVETYKHIQGVHIICVNFSAVYHNSKKKNFNNMQYNNNKNFRNIFILFYFILFTVSTNYHKFKYINKSYYLFL